MSDKEDKIIEDTEISNVYGEYPIDLDLLYMSITLVDVIKLKFPWYKWMHALMGTSPVVSHAAVANSNSVLDLSVLDDNSDCDKSGEENEEVCVVLVTVLDNPNTSTQKPIPWSSSPARDYGQESPGLDNSSDVGYLSPIVTPVKIKIPAASSMALKPSSVRKKTAADLAWEVANAEHQARLHMTRINAKERTAREQVKQRSARRSAIELEELRLRHQQEEGERQRAHELRMVERQIELERIRAGMQAPLSIDPQLQNNSFARF